MSTPRCQRTVEILLPSVIEGENPNSVSFTFYDTELTELKEEKEVLEKALKILRDCSDTHYGEKQRLQSQLEQARNENATLRKENEELKDAVSAAQGSQYWLDQSKKENERLRGEVNQAIKAHNETSKQANLKLETAKEQHDADMDRMQYLLDKARNANAKLHEQVSDLKTKLLDKQCENERLQEALTENRSDSDRMSRLERAVRMFANPAYWTKVETDQVFVTSAWIAPHTPRTIVDRAFFGTGSKLDLTGEDCE